MVALLLRRTGAIVRVEGEQPIRPRIRWSAEVGSGAWLGQIDGINLFTVIPHPMTEYLLPAPGSKWSLMSLLPGYDAPGRPVFNSQWEAEDAAERLLDDFIWRIGVRGMSTDNPESTDTIQMDAVVVETAGERTVKLDAVPPADREDRPTLAMEKVTDDDA